MKNLIVKVIGCCLLLMAGSKQIAASPFILESDTSKSASEITGSTGEPYIVISKANVTYPDLFTGNEEQSLLYIEKFAKARRDYLLRTYKRSKHFFPKAVSILKKYDVPQEFKVLLALESAFNANAISSAGAVGYWQIMDAVAREYGMKYGSHKKMLVAKKAKANQKNKKSVELAPNKAKSKPVADDRKNFNKSTHVAARYLRDRARNLNNDWLLIAASYNCGVGNVWNAMEKCGKKSPTFWDIKDLLPAETRAYVMNFMALNVVFHNYETFAANKLCFKDITCKLSELEPEECEEENETVYNTGNDY